MNHIELTIADLTAARNRADMMIQSLKDFQSGAFGAATPGPAEPVDGGAEVQELSRVTVPAMSTTRNAAPIVAAPPGAPRGTGKQAKPKTRIPRINTDTPVPETPKNVVALAAVDKPDTVVGAIKFLLRDEPEAFTRAEVIETLEGDKDWKKLIETPEGQRALDNALHQWTATGRLTKTGENPNSVYKVTAAGREWMNQ